MSGEILVVVGARPNFVKVAPVVEGLDRLGVRVRLLHTGQHYDEALSDAFFTTLGLPEPDVFLGVGSGTHGEQTAGVILGVERDLLARPPTAVLVAGDVNSTLAAALASAKVGTPVIHVESGLRSGDWSMPEEWREQPRLAKPYTPNMLHEGLLELLGQKNGLVAEEGLEPPTRGL